MDAYALFFVNFNFPFLFWFKRTKKSFISLLANLPLCLFTYINTFLLAVYFNLNLPFTKKKNLNLPTLYVNVSSLIVY